jgi:Ca2+-binding RTX toxin-like protein
MMYAELMAQTHLSGLYGKLSYTWDEEKQEQKVNFSSVIPDLLAGLNTNRQEGEQLLSEFARTLRGASICPHGCYQIFREHMLEIDPSLAWVIDTGGLPVYEHLHQGTRTGSPHIEGTDNADAVRGSLTEGDGWINGLNGDDVIYGTERNEQLVNGSGDALLVAGGGTDQIWAGPGDDILDGGPGDDLLYGETGNDTYIFRRGSGQDTIIDTDATAGNVDTIWLGSNLTPEDITLRRVGNNLVLKILDTTDSITVQDYFRNDSPLNRIEQIQEKGSNLVLDYE